MRIALASDHGGFEQKERLGAWLEEEGHVVSDFGTDSDESVDYPDFALPAALAVRDREADFGILVCGTGIGMQLAANKVHGIRAANVTDVNFAHLSREHNNCNVLTLSGRFVPFEENQRIVSEFLSTEFAGGRHERRVGKIMQIEAHQTIEQEG